MSVIIYFFYLANFLIIVLPTFPATCRFSSSSAHVTCLRVLVINTIISNCIWNNLRKDFYESKSFKVFFECKVSHWYNYYPILAMNLFSHFVTAGGRTMSWSGSRWSSWSDRAPIWASVTLISAELFNKTCWVTSSFLGKSLFYVERYVSWEIAFYDGNKLLPIRTNAFEFFLKGVLFKRKLLE